MSKIKLIRAREILDSRGNPTVEAEIELYSGVIGRASVPSGASTGIKEAIEKRDQDQTRFLGRGVKQAVAIIQGEIANALRDKNVLDQKALDDTLINLDGTEAKGRLGANSILAVSLAAAKAAALELKIPLYQSLEKKQTNILPVPMMNIINGGVHADNNLDFQEFMIIPAGAPTFSEALRAGAEIFHTLKRILKNKNYQTNVGDEGGFATDLPTQEAAFELILTAIQEAGYHAGKDIYLGIDAAASELYKNGSYYFAGQHVHKTADELIDYYAHLVKHYPIISIEDGMSEEDWEGWQKLTKRLGKSIQLVGDDLFVTNCKYLSQGIECHAANAILVKPNQIGTLSETLDAIHLALDHQYNVILSHRSGETEDTVIADIAVATGAGQIKTGSLCRSDRVGKYNQLLRIEEFLGDKAKYAGFEVFRKFSRLASSSLVV